MKQPTFAHRLLRFARNLILAASTLYLAAMLLLLPLWQLAPTSHALIRLTNVFAPSFFLPPLLLLPLLLLLRARWLVGAALVLLLVGAVLFVPRLQPASPVAAAPPEQPMLRVITFNQLYNNDDIAGTLEVLLAQDADVIALQELSYPLAQALEQQHERYPYRLLDPHHLPGGLGLVSRYPLEYVGPVHGLRAIEVRLYVDGQQVTLINVHPNPPHVVTVKRIPFTQKQVPLPTYDTSARDTQLGHLLARVADIEGPLMVAGDFNMADRDPLYATFDARLHDAFAETGWGFGHTYSNRWRLLPQVRIDYVWSSEDIQPQAAQVNCAARGSDHCMLVADLMLPR